MRHHGVDGLSCGSFLGHSIFDLAIKHDLVDKRTTTSATIQLDMYPWTFCLHTICWTNWTATSAPLSHGFFLERGRTLPLPWTSPGQKSPGHSALILGLEAIMHRTVFWNPQTCDTGKQIHVFRAVGQSFLWWPRRGRTLTSADHIRRKEGTRQRHKRSADIFRGKATGLRVRSKVDILSRGHLRCLESLGPSEARPQFDKSQVRTKCL